MTAKQLLSTTKRTCSITLRLMMVIFFLLSAMSLASPACGSSSLWTAYNDTNTTTGTVPSDV